AAGRQQEVAGLTGGQGELAGRRVRLDHLAGEQDVDPDRPGGGECRCEKECEQGGRPGGTSHPEPSVCSAGDDGVSAAGRQGEPPKVAGTLRVPSPADSEAATAHGVCLLRYL